MKFLYYFRNSTLVDPIRSQKNPLHNIARCHILILFSHPCCISLTTAIPSSHSRSFDYNLVVVPAHATKVQEEELVVYFTHSYHSDKYRLHNPTTISRGKRPR